MVKSCYFHNEYGQSFYYAEALPCDYDPKKRYPLLLFLHGAGERGNRDGSELSLVEKYSYLGRAREGEDFQAVILAPQCPRDAYWASYIESLNRFLDMALQTYAVNPKRVSLTGLSMGGTGTWLWSLSDPSRFSAIAPVCGSGVCWYGEKLINKPVWAFHGDIDDVVLPEESLNMVKSINKRGGHARLTLFHGIGHNAWEGAYQGRELFEWLISKEKESDK